jgi:hypothetical protein
MGRGRDREVELLCLPLPISVPAVALWLKVFIQRTPRIYCAFRVIIHSTIFCLSSGGIFDKVSGISFNP